MKTYEERKKETCKWCAKGWSMAITCHAPPPELAHMSCMPRCAALSHEDYEAELRAEIERLSRVPVMVGVSGVKTVPHAAYLSLRIAFDSVATVIQGAYLNGQLPPISDAELAEKIITEYSSKRASAYEQGEAGGCGGSEAAKGSGNNRRGTARLLPDAERISLPALP